MPSLVVDTREKNDAFGSSLLLANSPMSPKIVNGSFAAIFDADEFLAKVYAGIRISVSCLLNLLKQTRFHSLLAHRTRTPRRCDAACAGS